jgi:hypothetical protein
MVVKVVDHARRTAIIRFVLPSLPRAFIAVVLALSIGLHWTLLQTVAWAGMVVTYSRDASLTVALEKTFDGDHPCCWCKEIEKARKSEKNPDLKPELKQLTLLHQEQRWTFTPSTDFYLLTRIEPACLTIADQPPVPPPRFLVSNRA